MDPIRTLILTFSPAFNAPPIAVIASHRQGYPTSGELLRVFLECLTDAAPYRASRAALLTMLAQAPRGTCAAWHTTLSELGWDLGAVHGRVAHVSCVDTLLDPNRPGFSLKAHPQEEATVTVYTASAEETPESSEHDEVPSKLPGA